jgi:hypothetical protein
MQLFRKLMQPMQKYLTRTRLAWQIGYAALQQAEESKPDLEGYSEEKQKSIREALKAQSK